LFDTAVSSTNPRLEQAHAKRMDNST